MKKKDINEDELIGNPFLVPLIIPVRRVVQKTKDKDGIPQYGYYDMELVESTKFYLSPDVRALLSDLKGGSAQLLLWIMQKLENNKDYIWIKRSTCMSELGINSINTYKAGIKVLCQLRFIAPVCDTPDIYFINPQLFFNGSRHKRFPENLAEYIPKAKYKVEEDED